jgi:hypothetical protein
VKYLHKSIDDACTGSSRDGDHIFNRPIYRSCM